jgi:hypothetical protein
MQLHLAAIDPADLKNSIEATYPDLRVEHYRRVSGHELFLCITPPEDYQLDTLCRELDDLLPGCDVFVRPDRAVAGRVIALFRQR